MQLFAIHDALRRPGMRPNIRCRRDAKTLCNYAEIPGIAPVLGLVIPCSWVPSGAASSSAKKIGSRGPVPGQELAG